MIEWISRGESLHRGPFAIAVVSNHDQAILIRNLPILGSIDTDYALRLLADPSVRSTK